jgi:pyruvate formate lyase activating enzyme
LSGGEPLFQEEFALALLREARKRRIDTCIETCGNVPWPVLEEAGGLPQQRLLRHQVRGRGSAHETCGGIQ